MTGITGQDGSFLAELLLEQGYRITGLLRDQPRGSLGASEHLREQLELVSGDLLEPASLHDAIEEVRPSEIYHLAAPSFVPASWERPEETLRAIVGSTAAILEAVRELAPDTRVFVPASGAIFGESTESPQREDTPCHPSTPYAIAKLATHQLLGALRAHCEHAAVDRDVDGLGVHAWQVEAELSEPVAHHQRRPSLIASAVSSTVSRSSVKPNIRVGRL